MFTKRNLVQQIREGREGGRGGAGRGGFEHDEAKSKCPNPDEEYKSKR